MSDENETIEIVSPWVYIDRATPLALDYGDDGTELYGGLTVEEIEAMPLGLRPKPRVSGDSVDIEQHRAAFQRKWDKVKGIPKPTGYVPEVVTPPQVPCRDATEDEMPPECRDWLWALAAQQADMRYLRATYAVAGDVVILKRTGECQYCHAVATVNADGTLRKHNVPQTGNCIYSGAAPVQVDGIKGSCVCGTVKPLTKKGVMPAHKQPSVICESATSSEVSRSPRLLEVVTLPPKTTCVLRAVWASDDYVLACWAFDYTAKDGGRWEFDEGWTYDNGAKRLAITELRALMDERTGLIAAA